MMKAILASLWRKVCPPVRERSMTRRGQKWFCQEAAEQSPDLARLLALRISKQRERSKRKALEDLDKELQARLDDYNRRVSLCGVLGGMPDEDEYDQIMEQHKWRVSFSDLGDDFRLDCLQRRYESLANGGW